MLPLPGLLSLSTPPLVALLDCVICGQTNWRDAAYCRGCGHRPSMATWEESGCDCHTCEADEAWFRGLVAMASSGRPITPRLVLNVSNPLESLNQNRKEQE